jgi:FKBP-type peptidyl-prolyl cis-trans isomerase FkpA
MNPSPRSPRHHPSARRLVALCSAACVALVLATACSREGSEGADKGAASAPANPDPAQNTYAPALGVDLVAFSKKQSGLLYQDVTPGTGTVAIASRRVKVHYTGWLPNGTKFDSSRDRGEPIEFTLGQGEVIRGWDEGIDGMKVGGRRKLVIPADLAYGAAGSPPDIPPNAVLVFDVELMDVK